MKNDIEMSNNDIVHKELTNNNNKKGENGIILLKYDTKMSLNDMIYKELTKIIQWERLIQVC